MANIFLAYRIDQSLDYTYRLYGRLRGHFGVGTNLFSPYLTPVGVDRLKQIDLEVQMSDVLLVIIDENWATTSISGQKRLDDPSDIVRIALDAAFAYKVPVIPLLVTTSSMPVKGCLPESLRFLARQCAVAARTAVDFEDEFQDLTMILDTLLRQGSIKNTPRVMPEGQVPVSLVLPYRGEDAASNTESISTNSHQIMKVGSHNLSRRGDDLRIAIYAPEEVSKGDFFIIQAFCHLTGGSKEADELSREFDKNSVRHGFTNIMRPVRQGQRLRLHLTINCASVHFRIPCPIQVLVWTGVTACVQFEVEVSRRFPLLNLVGTILVSRRSVPLGQVSFTLPVNPVDSRKEKWRHTVTDNSRRCLDYSTTTFRKAFVSYSSKDRDSVLQRVQMLRPPISNLDPFQDIFGLEPGDVWSDRLYSQIDACDLFLLFWSSNARASQWVEKEWRYALSRRRLRHERPLTIVPVIIEGPPPVPPPDELSHLHFDDYLLYLSR